MKEKYSILRSADRYIEQRQYNKAIKVYKSLIASGESDPSVINDLGDLQFRDGDKASAQQNYVRAATSYAEIGDTLKAAGLCRKILVLDPSNELILDLLIELNQKREAVFDSRSLLAGFVDSALEQDDFVRATSLQEKLVDISPGEPSAHIRLAEIRFAAGLEDTAKNPVYRALELFSAGESREAGWAKIKEILVSSGSPENFQKFIEALEEGYVPVEPSRENQEVAEDEHLTASDSGREEVASPQFFEVDGPVGETEEAIEAGDFLEGAAPGEVEGQADSGDSRVFAPDASDVGDVPIEDDAEADAQEPEAEELEAALEEDSFELDIDDEELSGDRDRLLEMLGSDFAAEGSGEESPDGVEELKEDYSSLPVGMEETEEDFELDLDGDGLSTSDLEALGIQGLGESGVAEADDERAEEISSPEMDELILEEAESPESEPAFAAGGSEGANRPEPGEAEEIDSALEGIFVLDEQEGESFSEWAPEDVPELEYQADEKAGIVGEHLPGEDSVSDSDENPEVQMELGIAYRDMELLEDANMKFENALVMFEKEKATDKCILCCRFLAECCNELEKYQDTLVWVSRGLDYRKVSDDELVNFEYQSAIALEAMGDFIESLKGLRRIQSIHPGFRDVESRISSMESAGH